MYKFEGVVLYSHVWSQLEKKLKRYAKKEKRKLDIEIYEEPYSSLGIQPINRKWYTARPHTNLKNKLEIHIKHCSEIGREHYLNDLYALGIVKKVRGTLS